MFIMQRMLTIFHFTLSNESYREISMDIIERFPIEALVDEAGTSGLAKLSVPVRCPCKIHVYRL